MAKTSILGGRVVKVANRSGFDKSRLNLLTTGVGTITPIAKQLVIPSSGKLSVKIHAELPPLATDAFLRTHLKVEAFYVPLRICYGGFQSFFAGEPIKTSTGTYDNASLPVVAIFDSVNFQQGSQIHVADDDDLWKEFGPSSLTDYFDVKFVRQGGTGVLSVGSDVIQGGQAIDFVGSAINFFPYVAYHLIYDHFYRNKSVQRPAFAPFFSEDRPYIPYSLGSLPFSAYHNVLPIVDPNIDLANGNQVHEEIDEANDPVLYSILYDGANLFSLRQRNYGDDYFTAAKPSAQSGNPVSVQVDQNGRFTIASLRLQNALQEFAEVNNYATPDYIQAVASRYGVSPSSAIVQKPVLLGSADFPMFTKGVEMTAQTDDNFSFDSSRNPFARRGILGSAAGRAYANGSDFVCDWDVKEPGYIMVLATLVPEANYASGVAKDMRYFVGNGSLTDLPCSLLEGVGDEPIFQNEADSELSNHSVFGYVQRYLWHKIGALNSVHGLFRKGESLQAFAPQRNIPTGSTISTSFLRIPTTALDDVAAVESGISAYGVMMDCAIEMFVSEPLTESALPSLVDPAREHGKSIYLKNGGSELA